MVFTSIVALLMAGAKGLREFFPNPPDIVFIIPVWSVCFVVMGLAAVWATLGRTSPLVRCPFVFLNSLVLGALFCFGINVRDVAAYIYVISIMGVQSAGLLASLLLVRSRGYRLVRMPPPGPTASDESSASPENVGWGYADRSRPTPS
jgi:hypothetical protein